MLTDDNQHSYMFIEACIIYTIIFFTKNIQILSSAKQGENFTWSYKKETSEEWKTVQTAKQRWGTNKIKDKLVEY